MNYYPIRKKSIAEALTILGFHYLKFQRPEGTIYSFENTNEFQKALSELIQLKNKYNKYNKN